MTGQRMTAAGRLRSVTAAGLRLTGRRARRDIGLMATWGLLVALVAVLAVAGPRQLNETVDRGARQAVAFAGSGADVVVTVPGVAPQRAAAFAALIVHELPPVVSRVSGRTTMTLLGPATNVATIDGVATPSNVRVQIGMLTQDNTSGLRVTAGHLPGAVPTDGVIPVVISAADARAGAVTVGSEIGVATTGGLADAHEGKVILLRVVGIVAQATGSHNDWLDTSGLWNPTHPPSPQLPSPTGITVLTTLPGVTSAASRYVAAVSVQIRVHLVASRFSGDLEPRVTAAVGALSMNGSGLDLPGGKRATARSGLNDALSAYPAQSRAAVAQMSVVLAGLLGAAVAVLILVSQLLVQRRSREVTLERARGASLGSIAYRASIESSVVALLACGLGLGLAQVAIGGSFDDPIAFLIVLFAAILSAPVQSVLFVRREWSLKRVPANRRDRLEITRRTRGRRLAGEGAVFALAIAALVSLATRGLLETRTSGIDPLLVAAPVLCAVAITLLILRAYRAPVRALTSLARRTRGVLGTLGAARAENAIAALPLLALTLAVTLAVGGGVLVATVNDGQVIASWQRVGADVRVNAAVSAARAEALAAKRGVSQVASAHISADVLADLGTRNTALTLVAIDRSYPALEAHLPPGTIGGSSVTSLHRVESSDLAEGVLPVVVDTQLSRLLVSKNISIYYGDSYLKLRVVGVSAVEPTGYLHGPFIYVERASLAKRLAVHTTANALPASEIVALTSPNEVLINGSGALRAARSLGVPTSDIDSRSAWLLSRRHLALVEGTQQTILLATIAVALLAAIALVGTILAGARDRGRALGLLRTLGMRARLGWWLAFAELLPVVVAAVIGGVIAGIGIVAILAPSLGLRVPAGGLSTPPAVVPPLLLFGLVAVAGLLLALAVLVEVYAHRRDRLSEVLRVGETV